MQLFTVKAIIPFPHYKVLRQIESSSYVKIAEVATKSFAGYHWKWMDCSFHLSSYSPTLMRSLSLMSFRRTSKDLLPPTNSFATQYKVAKSLALAVASASLIIAVAKLMLLRQLLCSTSRNLLSYPQSFKFFGERWIYLDAFWDCKVFGRPFGMWLRTWASVGLFKVVRVRRTRKILHCLTMAKQPLFPLNISLTLNVKMKVHRKVLPCCFD